MASASAARWAALTWRFEPLLSHPLKESLERKRRLRGCLGRLARGALLRGLGLGLSGLGRFLVGHVAAEGLCGFAIGGAALRGWSLSTGLPAT